jgi:hypothetical protein
LKERQRQQLKKARKIITKVCELSAFQAHEIESGFLIVFKKYIYFEFLHTHTYYYDLLLLLNYPNELMKYVRFLHLKQSIALTR